MFLFIMNQLQSLVNRRIRLAPLISFVCRYHSTITPIRTANTRAQRILGIETSCDDTGAAIVTSDGIVLSEVIHLQQHLHEPHGGIVPTLALESHSAQLPGVIRLALEQANMAVTELDAIAVTRGPGIHACLSVGMNAAKTLAAALK
jgi:N6-L-threonylcarbamoyladenine synthase